MYGGDDGLYWRGRKWNGHVVKSDEGLTWLRGWNLDNKVRDALVVSVALGALDVDFTIRPLVTV